MNKTLIALALALGLAGCSQNASDQPENATANATAATTGINPSAGATGDDTLNDVGTGSGATGPAMGGTSTGNTAIGANDRYSANLDEELRRCDQLNGAERDTCRSDAQGRYDQGGTGTPTTP